MTDFAIARQHMIDNQLRPNRVRNERVVAAMAAVPREAYVPKPLQGIAYVDEDLQIAPGRHLMEPMVMARMLQAAEIAPTDVALDIGTGRGYSAAVLAQLAATVVALESDEELAAIAIETLAEQGVDNAAVLTGPLDEGCPSQAPYDVIFLSGGVELVPEALTAQLADDGRLVAVLWQGGTAETVLMQRRGEFLERRGLFNAAIPVLPGFEKPQAFEF